MRRKILKLRYDELLNREIQHMDRAASMVARVLMFGFQLILAYGGAVLLGGAMMASAVSAHAAMSAHTFALNSGASPASMNSGNMPQAALTTFYNTKFLENLKANLITLRLCTRETMPTMSGQVYRDFMYQPLGANTTQATEGTVQSGITVTTSFRDYVLGQFADYVNISDKAKATSINNDMVGFERELAYQLGLSMDDLSNEQFDYLRVTDSNTSNQDVLTGNYQITKQQIEQVAFSLMGQNVREMDNGYFNGKIHPFLVADMMALDNSNNSIVDILKHTEEGLVKLEELPTSGDGDHVKCLDLMGVRWMISTNCTQTAPGQSPVATASGQTAIRTYVAGKDAVISVKLDRKDRTDIGDGNYRNMNLWRGEYSMGNAFDPAGMIGAGASYNAIVTWGLPPDPVSRARCFDAVPQTT